MAKCGDISRAVFDTNVFVGAGFNPGSSSALLLELVAAGKIKLVWSDATKQETASVLRQIPRLSWDKVEPLFIPEARCSAEVDLERFNYIVDPDDRKFAALATAAEAPLVTSDNHFLEHRHREDLVIRTPSEFLADLGFAEKKAG